MSFYSVERVSTAIKNLIDSIDRDDKDALFIPLLSKVRKNFPQMHFHEYPELFIQVQTKDLFVFPDEKKIILPGQACLIPRGLPHKEIVEKDKQKFENIVVRSGDEGIAIHFAYVKPEAIHPSIRDIRVFYTEESYRAFQYLNDAIEYFHIGYAYTHPLVKYPMTMALHVMLRAIERLPNSNSKIHHKISLCKSIILSQLHDPKLNIIKLANKVGTSADYLGRLFQKEAGCSLNHYIQQQRISMARELLIKSDLDINQICFQTGFADPSYFTKVFKKMVQMSPKEYRRKAN